MAKRDKYNPDYKELYPGEKISPEVLKVLKQSDRKMKYMEVEIKHGVFRQDMNAKTAAFAPTREDSLDRLLDDEKMDFVSAVPSPEETAVHSDEINRLCAALKRLNPEEYALIHALFFEGISERAYAARVGSHYMTIHNRKVKIQEKLKKLLEK